jgi:acyl dehydratase
VPIRARDRFSADVILSQEQISAFASAAGDWNPLHHDPDYAPLGAYRGLVTRGEAS